MESLRTYSVAAGQRYGALPSNFYYDVRAGYTALVGPNNAGKSTLLQLVFRQLMGDDEFGAERIGMILPDRNYVEPTTQTGGRVLAHWNQELMTPLNASPLQYGAGVLGPSRSELTRLLLHGNFIQQMRRLSEELLPRLGFPPAELAGDQQVQFEQLVVYFQGTGLRAILPILAALTNTNISALLIDEPELSLEPRLQKALRDLLLEAADSKRVVMVATHSHLFLNRAEPDSTQIVTKNQDGVVVETVATQRQLLDLTFDLLGSSTEDLFFPHNYLIVEGASDQVVAEKVLALLGARGVKVLSAQEIDEVRERLVSVVRALVPLIVDDSPYADRVVALIDQPRKTETAHHDRLQKDLVDRLFILDAPSLEAYVPAEIYERAGRDQGDDLAELERSVSGTILQVGERLRRRSRTHSQLPSQKPISTRSLPSRPLRDARWRSRSQRPVAVPPEGDRPAARGGRSSS